MMVVNVCLHFAEDVEEEEEKVLSGRLKKTSARFGTLPWRAYCPKAGVGVLAIFTPRLQKYPHVHGNVEKYLHQAFCGALVLPF